jgi:PAS domain S-box-containing protein
MTEQKETEKALYESERRMRTFIDESLLAIYLLDVKTRRIIYCNEAFRELLGYTDAETGTLKVYDFIERSKEDVDKHLDKIADIKKTQGGERQWKRKDGKTVHVLVSSIYQVRNGEDAIFVAAQDISKRKQAEERLQVTNKELETFIYKSSHDIRGPLASILGLVNITMLECHDEVIRNYLAMIQTASNKLDNILQNLVNAMKIREIGALDQRIDFPLLIHDVYGRFSHYEDYKKIKFTYEVDLNEKEFRSNQFILDTVFHNLVENAIKYINKSSENPYLKIKVSSLASGILISFQDNGIGIDPSLQGKIFEMYFRATDKSKGSGLGLYLVKQSVDKLNGQVFLQSETGKGSTFMVELPFTTG